MRFCIAALLLLGACRTQPLELPEDAGLPASGDLAMPGGGVHDLAAPRDLHATPTSCCGKPGNPGNELGVGKFCQTGGDCANQTAAICAAEFQPGADFCTMPCTPGSTNCGSGASCQCAGANQCACVPGECVQPPPGC